MILAVLVKDFVSVWMRSISVMHPPRVVYSQQSRKLVVWTWGVFTFHRQICKRGFCGGPFIGTGWIPILILVLEVKACTPEEWFERAQVRGEQATRGALAPELGMRLFVCRSMCLQSCRKAVVQDKCFTTLGGRSLPLSLIIIWIQN